METFIDRIETGTREEFMDSITNACEEYGFIHGDEEWSGDTIYVKIKAGRVEFDIIAKYEEDEFNSITFCFSDEITAYHLDSCLEYDRIKKEWKTSYGYTSSDRQDALNNIGEYYNAIIAYDEGSFIVFGDKYDECKEDNTFNDMEWFSIAISYGEL